MMLWQSLSTGSVGPRFAARRSLQLVGVPFLLALVRPRRQSPLIGEAGVRERAKPAGWRPPHERLAGSAAGCDSPALYPCDRFCLTVARE